MGIRISLILAAALAFLGAPAATLVAQPNGRGYERASTALASPEAIGRLIEPVVGDRGGLVGVAIYSVERRVPLYLRHADEGLLPASNMKLYTTAAALDRLGPDYSTRRLFTQTVRSSPTARSTATSSSSAAGILPSPAASTATASPTCSIAWRWCCASAASGA